MCIDALARFFAHDITDADPKVEFFGFNHCQNFDTAAGMCSAHGRKPHCIEAFSTVVQNDQKLPHGGHLLKLNHAPRHVPTHRMWHYNRLELAIAAGPVPIHLAQTAGDGPDLILAVVKGSNRSDFMHIAG